jgi:ring-1,2-phenylacetyl-CoA epoxidase subunit PaaE
MTPKFHELNIEKVIRETDDTVSISFQIPDELQKDYQYLSGQYLTIKRIIGGNEIRRSYSLCSSPYENCWKVAVKQINGGLFSKFANNELHQGMKLEVMTPTGNFVIHPHAENEKTYVLFASGSGITPILSITKTILKEEPKSNVTLIYGNKGFNSIIFREDIEALKNRFMDRLRVVHVFSRESIGNPLQKGRIDRKKAGELYEAFLKNNAIDACYVCGPEEMILGVKECLIDNGVEASKIHFELFTSPVQTKEKISLPNNSPRIESNISIILDGDRIDLNLASTGQNILDAAQAAGADLPFACKGGVCCTCKAKILEGSASMDVNYALESEEVEAGFILTCQSHPTSDRLVISFDE